MYLYLVFIFPGLFGGESWVGQWGVLRYLEHLVMSVIYFEETVGRRPTTYKHPHTDCLHMFILQREYSNVLSMYWIEGWFTMTTSTSTATTTDSFQLWLHSMAIDSFTSSNTIYIDVNCSTIQIRSTCDMSFMDFCNLSPIEHIALRPPKPHRISRKRSWFLQVTNIVSWKNFLSGGKGSKGELEGNRWRCFLWLLVFVDQVLLAGFFSYGSLNYIGWLWIMRWRL